MKGNDEGDSGPQTSRRRFGRFGGLDFEVYGECTVLPGVFEDAALLIDRKLGCAVILFPAACSENSRVRVAAREIGNEIDSGFRIAQIVKAEFQERIAVAILGIGGGLQFGSRLKTESDTGSRK